jgi:uncharacterized membrane protein
MKKKGEHKNWIAIGLSGIAIIISIIAICFAAYRTPELQFDYIGVLVGIIALLVTVLIGWNIYTLIDIKETSQRLNEFRAEFEKKIESVKGEVEFNVKLEIMKTVPVLIALENRDLIQTLKFMFNVFHENTNNNTLAKAIAREYILQSIMSIIKSNDEEFVNNFTKKMKGVLKTGEIEDFLHEFMSYSKDEKNQKYDGIQNILLELLKSQS